MAYLTDRADAEIVRLLSRGGVGLVPSDTIYGLSAAALDEVAVMRVNRLKARDSHKPFIVLIADIKMLNMLSIPESQAKIAEPYWPGALSVIFPAKGSPAWLSGGSGTLAVRLPDHQELCELIDKVGPIISTSANSAGGVPARDVKEARAFFGEQLDFYIDVGKLDNPPSTLVKINDGRLDVVRQGSVKIAGKET